MICHDFQERWDVIPKPHLEWFKEIFLKNNRSAPPLPDGAPLLGIFKPVLISSLGKFKVKILESYKESIRSVHFSNGNTYVITKTGIYKGSKLWYSFTKKHRQIGLIDVPYNDPMIITKEGISVIFMDVTGASEATLTAKEAMEYNGLLYTLQAGYLREHVVERFKKVVISTKTIAQVMPNSRVYKGVIVQEILGKIWLAIPYEPCHCFNEQIKELEGYRIINAKYENHFCIIMAEKESKYHRIVLHFNETHSNYSFRITEDVSLTDISFAVNNQGICVISINSDCVEVTKDNKKIYEYTDSPLDPDMKLLTDGLSVMFFNNRKLYEVKLT